ncbi:MAG TPA: LuxR C-terminal-related transcriptional regulator, partial [Chitinophagaceae bacterium]|nr:LuxR C-terminal-related transcriptional regulator [Chitinophagaceae bacterium]
GGQTEKVLGCPPPEVNIPFLMGNIHPGDYPAVINFESKVFHFFASLQPEKMLRYKVRYDFRIRKQNGSFIRILHQLRVCQQDKNGTPLLGLGVHSDITYLKPHGKPALSYIDMDKEATGLHADIKNSTPVGKNGFTPREKEVLTLLIDGKLSKEISNILHISKQTVDTHRKNMLHKKELSNTGELIGKAIRSGWI